MAAKFSGVTCLELQPEVEVEGIVQVEGEVEEVVEVAAAKASGGAKLEVLLLRENRVQPLGGQVHEGVVVACLNRLKVLVVQVLQWTEVLAVVVELLAARRPFQEVVEPVVGLGVGKFLVARLEAADEGLALDVLEVRELVVAVPVLLVAGVESQLRHQVALRVRVEVRVVRAAEVGRVGIHLEDELLLLVVKRVGSVLLLVHGSRRSHRCCSSRRGP